MKILTLILLIFVISACSGNSSEALTDIELCLDQEGEWRDSQCVLPGEICIQPEMCRQYFCTDSCLTWGYPEESDHAYCVAYEEGHEFDDQYCVRWGLDFSSYEPKNACLVYASCKPDSENCPCLEYAIKD
jgi:hypothetical protein